MHSSCNFFTIRSSKMRYISSNNHLAKTTEQGRKERNFHKHWETFYFHIPLLIFPPIYFKNLSLWRKVASSFTSSMKNSCSRFVKVLMMNTEIFNTTNFHFHSLSDRLPARLLALTQKKEIFILKFMNGKGNTKRRGISWQLSK